ncbi:MAG: hypothetical protein WAL22_00560 [Solirubrobacteraceae bacterium]
MAAADARLPLTGELPELADVPWRPLVDETSLRRADHRWTAWTIAHELPLLATAAGLVVLSPILIPVSLAALAFAWFIPDLYAAKGAEVLRPPRAAGARVAGAEGRAIGLLGDLVGDRARELLRETGLLAEQGALGVWLVGGKGAVLVRGRGRRVQCYCVRAKGDDLPLADRVAHLLLALRADERGFATVANLSFSGARWRLARKLPGPARVGLAAAVSAARPAGR